MFLFFFMEETNYTRHSPENMLASAASETIAQSPVAKTPSNEKATLSSLGEPRLETGTTILQQPTKTYWNKIALFQMSDLKKPNHLGGMALRPLIFLTFPVIFFAGFSYGSNLVWFNVLNATASLILGETYGFKASMVGLSYVSPLIGVAIGAAYTGLFGDRFVLNLARRRNGILESEYRLWLFAPSVLLIPFGLILWGVGAAHHVQWFGCVFAMCLISITNTIGLQLSVAYCVDSYRALSGEAIVTVILVRNTMSFAIGYGITPWVQHMGLQNAFITAAFAGMAQVLTVGIFLKWGKRLREASVPRYEKYYKQMARDGMAH